MPFALLLIAKNLSRILQIAAFCIRFVIGPHILSIVGLPVCTMPLPCLP